MSEPTFVRRRFTITEALNGVLNEMAKKHYQGNVSLCLRAAIEDHRKTLQGTSSASPEIQHLGMKVQTMAESQQNLEAAIEDLRNKPDTRSEQDDSQADGPPGVSGDQLGVYEAIEDSDAGLRIEDLLEKLDLPASRIQPALGALLDTAYVVRSAENRRRFVVPGDSVASNPGDQQ